MPARRDYALVWRDSIATLAQLPVAALSASDYFSREWVGRSRAFMMHVVDRLVLARPADAGPLDNVMADVLADDLTDATTAFVRDLVSLPGQTAMHFNQCVEAMSTSCTVSGMLTSDTRSGCSTPARTSSSRKNGIPSA